MKFELKNPLNWQYTWHEWFAWFPIIAVDDTDNRILSQWDETKRKNTRTIVWLEKVMRKSCITNASKKKVWKYVLPDIYLMSVLKNNSGRFEGEKSDMAGVKNGPTTAPMSAQQILNSIARKTP